MSKLNWYYKKTSTWDDLICCYIMTHVCRPTTFSLFLNHFLYFSHGMAEQTLKIIRKYIVYIQMLSMYNYYKQNYTFTKYYKFDLNYLALIIKGLLTRYFFYSYTTTNFRLFVRFTRKKWRFYKSEIFSLNLSNKTKKKLIIESINE